MLGRYRDDVTETADGPLSLTSAEAEERFALLDVERYDVAVDLRGLFEGEVLEATSTATFRCHQPGASTFVDCTGEITHATLNGVDLDPATATGGRPAAARPAGRQRPRGELPAERHEQRPRDPAHVDASDKLVYLWTTFEPDHARRAFANFDQPDLKAVHAFTISAPDTWTVTSNSAHTAVDDLPDGGRVWRFADTPRLSTYVTVFNAGPFYEIRERRGDHDLGLYCRQSLKHLLDRDAAELFELTEQGLAWFGEKFGAPFPQEKYDQVFVPDMGGRWRTGAA
jgi:aminopeptidase N